MYYSKGCGWLPWQPLYDDDDDDDYYYNGNTKDNFGYFKGIYTNLSVQKCFFLMNNY